MSLNCPALLAGAVALSLAACANGPQRPAGGPPPAASTAETAPAPAAEGTGENVVVGRLPPPVGGFPSIVLFNAENGPSPPPVAGKAVMDQVNMTFTPAVLLLRKGQTAEFRNSDDTLHNVRVREEATKAGTFNVAIPNGAVYEHTFEREGFYDVGCDIHPAMSAQILVTVTPYAAVGGPDGSFTLRDMPPGAYAAIVYTGAKVIERHIEVRPGRTELDMTTT